MTINFLFCSDVVTSHLSMLLNMLFDSRTVTALLLNILTKKDGPTLSSTENGADLSAVNQVLSYLHYLVTSYFMLNLCLFFISIAGTVEFCLFKGIQFH